MCGKKVATSVAVVFGLLLANSTLANEEKGISKKEAMARARGSLENIFRDNGAFTRKHEEKCFDPFLAAQSPRTTLVTCSDSRLHTYALDETPDNDLFVVRNIGNQIKNSEGSVEYGIKHLGTNLLLILGHTGCGAVKAALGETNKLEVSIRKELDPLVLSQKKLKSISEEIWFKSVQENVHNQVKFAQKKFKDEVAAGKLSIVGAVFDLHNMFGHGNGRVVIIDVDGITTPKDLERHPLLKDTTVVLPN